MNIRIEVELTKGSIKAAIAEVNELIFKIEQAEKLLTERLATVGAFKASTGFASAVYTGTFGHDIDVVPIEGGYSLIASGENIGFVEFGAGITYGYGHPDVQGYGPGTWPEGRRQNKDYANWENPKGWRIPGGSHTYGNPPNAAMYNAKVEIMNAVAEVAREVFK